MRRTDRQNILLDRALAYIMDIERDYSVYTRVLVNHIGFGYEEAWEHLVNDCGITEEDADRMVFAVIREDNENEAIENG